MAAGDTMCAVSPVTMIQYIIFLPFSHRIFTQGLLRPDLPSTCRKCLVIDPRAWWGGLIYKHSAPFQSPGRSGFHYWSAVKISEREGHGG